MSRPHLVRGIGVSPGVAFAPAMVVRLDFPDVPDRGVHPDQVESEVQRLHQAAAAVVAELEALRARVLLRAGEEESRIFDAQILMVQDADFLRSVETLIRNNQLSAETAFEFKALELRSLWSGSGSARLRERLADLTATQRRILQQLLGTSTQEWWTSDLQENVIVVARELSPGLTVQLDRDHVVGLISEEGTRTSHAAILAHSLGIPAVMGVSGALDQIRGGTMLLINGQSGAVLLDPTHGELEEARAQRSRRHRLELELEAAATDPVATPDGRRLTLLGNVDLPEEIEPTVRHGAEGVGLLRTEFLLTGRTSLPSEDEQYHYFRRVADAFRKHPVVIRSFDLGGDKFPAAFRAPAEANPFLGWRSIRVCLDRPEIFRPQLRAVLRAAVDRELWLMLPLVTRVEEVVAVRALLEEETANLRQAGVRAAAKLPVGVMVETPAAVILADQLAEVSDFFSVGTNDLTQYTLVVDRGNARLASRFTTHHPAVLRQLDRVLAAGRAAKIPVSICGEFASEPLLALLLVGLGFESLSVSPPALPMVKWAIRAVPFADLQPVAAAALAATSSELVLDALRQVAAQYLDIRLVDLPGALPRADGPATFTADESSHQPFSS